MTLVWPKAWQPQGTRKALGIMIVDEAHLVAQLGGQMTLGGEA